MRGHASTRKGGPSRDQVFFTTNLRATELANFREKHGIYEELSPSGNRDRASATELRAILTSERFRAFFSGPIISFLLAV